MGLVVKSFVLFVLAGLCEIGGGYLVWQWWRNGAPWLLGLLGAAVLVLYGIVPTYQPAHFGRVYAAYGGKFVDPFVALGGGGAGGPAARAPLPLAAADPAGGKGKKNGADALRSVAERVAVFLSRGDRSGTHTKEKALWKAAGLAAKGPWYIESGQGMGATLTIASEKGAYTLADRATHLAFKRLIQLMVLLEGDPALLNIYHVLEVSQARHPRVNAAGGKAFADFMLSAGAQQMIKTFGVEKYGEPLFFVGG